MIKIRSDNPKFSWILRKNPETQTSKNSPFIKALRKGTAIGWFHGEQEFRMFFKDSPTESSFNTIGDFEYLDRTRYTSPYLPIALIGSLLASAQKDVVDEDQEGFISSLECNIELPKHALAKRILRAIDNPSMNIQMEQVHALLYRVTFQTDKGIRYLLNMVISFLITQSVLDEKNYVQIDDESVMKYINAMNVIDAPYYMRYIFSANCIKSPVLFGKVLGQLQGDKCIMNFGDTQDHRWTQINDALANNRGKNLIDIGCGELFYTKRLASKYVSVKAYDYNLEIQEKNAFFLEKRSIENVTLLGAYTVNVPNDATCDDDILITEVLEHMPLEIAEGILNHVLSGDFNKVIVTMPNKDFNVHYGMPDDMMRHDDHHYEPTEEQFVIMMSNASAKHPCDVEFIKLGDGVNGQHASLMCVFTKEKYNE